MNQKKAKALRRNARTMATVFEPTVQRYVQQLDEAGKSIDSVHPYTFVHNDGTARRIYRDTKRAEIAKR